MPFESPAAAKASAPAFSMVCSPGIFTGFRAAEGWNCNATVEFYASNSTSGQLGSLGVDTGSYTLLFRVGLSPWPTGWNSGYLPPGWHEQQIPVCTAGGAENFAWSGKPGGGQTDAVENCPPEEQ